MRVGCVASLTLLCCFAAKPSAFGEMHPGLRGARGDAKAVCGFETSSEISDKNALMKLVNAMIQELSPNPLK